MTGSILQPRPPRRRRHRVDRGDRPPEPLSVTLVLQGPVVAFMASLFLVKPLGIGGTFSLTFAAPALLLIGIVMLRVPRSFIRRCLGAVAIEFALLGLLVLLSLLSLVNSDSPIRSFRIIYPSLLPAAVFTHFALLAHVSPERLRRAPRTLIFAAVIFSVIPLFLSMAVPPLQSFLFGAYRMRGFFENSIQHSIALATLMPLLVGQYATSHRVRAKLLWGVLTLVMAYTLFRAGSKAAMAVGLASGVAFYALLALRSRNPVRIATVAMMLGALALFLWAYGLTIAEMLNPVIAEKLRNIFEDGISNYQSIESRQQLWNEAINEGQRHWLIGTGAGEKVLGVSHAHNLVLDYFKGLGIFGAAAIVLLCLTILTRTASKALFVLAGEGNDRNVQTLACYLGASVYVVCNQLSDCFGPSTVGFLWTIYLAGRLMDPKCFPGRRFPP